jgi:hypothetical protein
MTAGNPAALPATVQLLLDGSDLPSTVGTTILLATTTAEGRPNIAMLSPGEVLARDAGTVLLALHATSRTTRALRASGRGLLHVVADGAAHRISLRVRAVVPPSEPGGDALFVTDVAEALEDRVPYAEVTSGITYRLRDVPEALARWTAKHEQLRRLP